MGIRATFGALYPYAGREDPPLGCSGGIVNILLLSLCRLRRDVHDLQLQPVRVVEEDRVVPRHVPVLLWAALDLGALGCEPIAALVDNPSGRRFEREMVEADPIPVVLTL